MLNEKFHFLCRYAVWILIFVLDCNAMALDENVTEEMQALVDTNKFGRGGVVHFLHLYNALSKDTIPCDAPQTQAEMNACSFKKYKEADAELNKVYREADAELNRVYKDVMAQLTQERKRKKLLKAAELAWIKYRDAHSEFEAFEAERGGRNKEMYLGCLTSMTVSRTEELKKERKYLHSVNDRN